MEDFLLQDRHDTLSYNKMQQNKYNRYYKDLFAGPSQQSRPAPRNKSPGFQLQPRISFLPQINSPLSQQSSPQKVKQGSNIPDINQFYQKFSNPYYQQPYLANLMQEPKITHHDCCLDKSPIPLQYYEYQNFLHNHLESLSDNDKLMDLHR